MFFTESTYVRFLYLKSHGFVDVVVLTISAVIGYCNKYFDLFLLLHLYRSDIKYCCVLIYVSCAH